MEEEEKERAPQPQPQPQTQTQLQPQSPTPAPTPKGVVEKLVEELEGISSMVDYRNAYKKQFCNLARRLRLLAPLFEELSDGGVTGEPMAPEAHASLVALSEVMKASRELLRLGWEGSKIFLVLEGDKILKRFQEITTLLEQALGEIPFDKMDISDEVREQVELVHAQFRRAKERIDMPDVELYSDLLSAYDKRDVDEEHAVIKRLAEKLQLMTISDLTQESLALHEMVLANGGADPGENIEKMSMLLKKIKDYIQTQNPEMGMATNMKGISFPPHVKSTAIPDDFRCPISLELMKDPVIVATGQTYERDSINKWLEAGQNTCPKTQQRLPNKSLTPNYVLRSLIAQWCEANGLEAPKRPMNTSSNKSPTMLSSELAKIEALLLQLGSTSSEDQCAAAGQLRLLAKCSAESRICIAESGAIPLLVSLLPTQDPGTQEHAVTALLNLSICEENKRSIMISGAVPGIVHVLKKGNMEARENAAAALFSLSVVDENKVTIGVSGAIPALALLLKEGTQRGKKDAATALFNLCIYQGNKGKAVRAGVIPTLMELLTEPSSRMVDEALAVLAILASHSEGKAAVKPTEAIPVLVELIGVGSSRNKENAAAILVHLFSGEQQYEHLTIAHDCGVLGPLLELAQNGTDRGKRKANQLIDRLGRFLEKQAVAQVSNSGSPPSAVTSVNE